MPGAFTMWLHNMETSEGKEKRMDTNKKKFHNVKDAAVEDIYVGVKAR